jgi:hypothetical protein
MLTGLKIRSADHLTPFEFPECFHVNRFGRLSCAWQVVANILGETRSLNVYDGKRLYTDSGDKSGADDLHLPLIDSRQPTLPISNLGLNPAMLIGNIRYHVTEEVALKVQALRKRKKYDSLPYEAPILRHSQRHSQGFHLQPQLIIRQYVH